LFTDLFCLLTELQEVDVNEGEQFIYCL